MAETIELEPVERFAIRITHAARERLRQFDMETRDHVHQILDELADNPGQDPQRIRVVSPDGPVFLYSHYRPDIEITFKIDRVARIIDVSHFAPVRIGAGKPLFISYSRSDQDWLKKVRLWLAALEQKNLVRIWADTDIQAGQDWRKEIERALAEAKAALLLVTQNFLASDFIARNELPRILDAAREKGLVILWIAVDESTYEAYGFERYQAVNDPKRPLAGLQDQDQKTVLKEIFVKISDAIKDA